MCPIELGSSFLIITITHAYRHKHYLTSAPILLHFTAYSGTKHSFHQPNQITEQNSLDKLMLSKSLTLTRMKELKFDCNGGNFHSPEDDYSLTVPKGAIPEKLGLISMQCGVIPYGPFGPFKYPDGVKPVSPIVWFCSTTSLEFQKPVEITIPHCLDCDSEEDSQSLAFFKANHNVSDSDPPTFHFLKETEGVSSFPSNTFHGTLHSKHLCFYCIGTQDKEITDRANFCLIMAEPKCFQWRIHFCLTYLLKTCIQVNNKQVLILLSLSLPLYNIYIYIYIYIYYRYCSH